MKHKKLNDALNEVSDKYLEEAARGQKRKAPRGALYYQFPKTNLWMS